MNYYKFAKCYTLHSVETGCKTYLDKTYKKSIARERLEFFKNAFALYGFNSGLNVKYLRETFILSVLRYGKLLEQVDEKTNQQVKELHLIIDEVPDEDNASYSKE